MTVIVALPDRMLSDSICTTGDTNYPSQKVFRIRNELVGTAGDTKSIEKFLRWYSGNRRKPLDLTEHDDFSVVVINKRGIWDYSNSSMPDRVLRGFHGVGSGWGYAHAAMLCGKDPRDAIEIACQVTHLCGLPVQEFALDASQAAIR